MNEPKTQVALLPEPEQNMLAMLERIALNPDVTADKLERLLAIQERVMAKRAEDEFNIAMTAAQSETGRISADATNPQTHSRYATYGKLDSVLRPIYTKHGFALSFSEGETTKLDHIRILCYVSHRGGHTRMYPKDVPSDGKGAKGGDVMTKTHAAGAAQSYAMRYILKGVFNVAIGDEDNDGNGPAPATITTPQISDLEKLMLEVGVIGERRERALKVWHVTALTEIAIKDYAAIMQQLESKRK